MDSQGGVVIILMLHLIIIILKYVDMKMMEHCYRDGFLKHSIIDIADLESQHTRTHTHTHTHTHRHKVRVFR